jgi:hypothetical protein
MGDSCVVNDKAKLSLCLTKGHVIKEYGRVEVQLLTLGARWLIVAPRLCPSCSANATPH